MAVSKSIFNQMPTSIYGSNITTDSATLRSSCVDYWSDRSGYNALDRLQGTMQARYNVEIVGAKLETDLSRYAKVCTVSLRVYDPADLDKLVHDIELAADREKRERELRNAHQNVKDAYDVYRTLLALHGDKQK
jgi:hypothetical protein